MSDTLIDPFAFRHGAVTIVKEKRFTYGRDT